MFHFFLFRSTYIEREAGESSNDRNDRAIRGATKWYQEHLDSVANGRNNIKVILLSDDVSNKLKAEEDGILGFSSKLRFL